MPITVDEQGRPERNREIYVFDLGQNLKGKDEDGNEAMLFGSFIVTSWDHRWASKQKGKMFYSCKPLTDRILHIRVPAYEYSLLYGMNSFAMQPDQIVVKGLASGASGFINQKAYREWLNIALIFPVGTKLSAKAIGDEGEVLKLNCFAIKLDGKVDAYCGWTIADIARDARPIGDVQAPKEEGMTAEAEAAAQLAALGI